MSKTEDDQFTRPGDDRDYGKIVRECLDTIMEHGTDRYGTRETPVLVSILDVESLDCPSDPAPLDEEYRVRRGGRRNPAGSGLMVDQPLLRAMYRVSETTGDDRYADCARDYSAYVMDNLVDDKNFFWWGWHRHYDVFRDECDGHYGSPHELHGMFEIDWDRLWNVNPDAVRREIDAIWKWHVVDKDTGEVNRHGDGQRGCDFSMSAGAHLQAFAFMHEKTGDDRWRQRARRVTGYYWNARNPETNLFPERPNAGEDRFDGSTFATVITGLHCYSLMRAWQLTGDDAFQQYARAYLEAYAKLGYDESQNKFWGALNLDGTPIPGPRASEEYVAAQPRGHLDLWQPYIAGYEFPIFTAQSYAYAAALTDSEELLQTAHRFADWIEREPPGSPSEHENARYAPYSQGPGRQGTYAGYYGRTISFLLTMFAITDEPRFLERADGMARDALNKLYHPNGIVRGHPAKPYYESVDGTGYLLVGLLQLDHVMNHEDEIVTDKHYCLNW